MKDKDLITFYRVFSNLYGAILDKDAFKIIKKYFPEFTMEEFKKDLKKRLRSLDRSYQVRKWHDGEYVIRGPLNNKETHQLFFLQANKPYYVPETFEEFKEFMYYGNINKHTDGILRKIAKLCLNYVNYFDGEFAKTLAFALAEDTQLYVLQHIQPHEVIAHLRGSNGIDFTPEDEKKYLELYNKLRLETRTKEDCGFTRKEINEFYYYDELLRPLLKKGEATFLKDLEPKDVDINFFNNVIDNSRSFNEAEKIFIKQELFNFVNGNNQITA